jgi:ABC-type transport system involved in multi-copper enzyme maturation permease subunit
MILPLFSRELTERAARRRTYATRAVFGFLLYAIFLFATHRTIERAGGEGNTFAVLGTGRDLFEQLVWFLCWSVYFFQPALMAGGITYEKERESLSLLLLTGMSSGKILAEKFLAGLLPMATLLLLALPLGAITMGYGGVSIPLLISGALVVCAAWLHVGAFAILCSAWCRTTNGAILATYLGTFVIQAVPLLLGAVYRLFSQDVELPGWAYELWPPAAFARILDFQNSASVNAALASQLAWATLRNCAYLLGLAVVYLLLARLFIERRASVSVVRNPTARRIVEKAGRLAKWWRDFWPKGRDFPRDNPVTWRESGRGIFGGRGRFAKVTCWLAIGAVVICVILFVIHPRTLGPQRIQVFAMIVGVSAVLVLVTRSVGSLLDERANQTLDILLTTRLGASQILQEKVDALTRYRVLFWILLAIIFGAQGYSEYRHVRANMDIQGLAQFWFCGTLAASVYPSLVIWLAMAFALLLRSKARAVAATMAVIAIWFLGPIVALEFLYSDWRASSQALWTSLLSPLGILDANAHGRLAYFAKAAARAGREITTSGSPGAPVAFNFSAYTTVTIVLRWLCLFFAERLLRTTRR